MGLEHLTLDNPLTRRIILYRITGTWGNAPRTKEEGMLPGCFGVELAPHGHVDAQVAYEILETLAARVEKARLGMGCLGNHPCLNKKDWNNIQIGFEAESRNGLSLLTTHGIFGPYSAKESREYFSLHMGAVKPVEINKKIWGLTKEGKWLLVEVECEAVWPDGSCAPFERAIFYTGEFVSLEAFLDKVDPANVIHKLYYQIENWYTHYKDYYEKACVLHLGSRDLLQFAYAYVK